MISMSIAFCYVIYMLPSLAYDLTKVLVFRVHVWRGCAYSRIPWNRRWAKSSRRKDGIKPGISRAKLTCPWGAEGVYSFFCVHIADVYIHAVCTHFSPLLCSVRCYMYKEARTRVHACKLSWAQLPSNSPRYKMPLYL